MARKSHQESKQKIDQHGAMTRRLDVSTQRTVKRASERKQQRTLQTQAYNGGSCGYQVICSIMEAKGLPPFKQRYLRLFPCDAPGHSAKRCMTARAQGAVR
eukprot:1120318-Pyramimonas_sp.AAC.1